MLDGCHLSSFVHRAASGALYGPEGLFDISRSCLTLGSFLKPISFSIPIPNSKQCDKQISEQTASRQDLCSPKSFQTFLAVAVRLVFSPAAPVWMCLTTDSSSSSPQKLIFCEWFGRGVQGRTVWAEATSRPNSGGTERGSLCSWPRISIRAAMQCTQG